MVAKFCDMCYLHSSSCNIKITTANGVELTMVGESWLREYNIHYLLVSLLLVERPFQNCLSSKPSSGWEGNKSLALLWIKCPYILNLIQVMNMTFDYFQCWMTWCPLSREKLRNYCWNLKFTFIKVIVLKCNFYSWLQSHPSINWTYLPKSRIC